MPLLSQLSANSFYFPARRDSIEDRLAVSHTRSPELSSYSPWLAGEIVKSAWDVIYAGVRLVALDGSSYAVPLEEITPCLRS